MPSPIPKKTIPLTKEQQDVVAANRGLVYDIVFKRSEARMSHDDQIQEGMIALANAVTCFKPELGWKFSTYAVWAIRRRLARMESRSNLVRVPGYLQSKRQKDNNLQRFARQSMRTISMECVAADVDWQPAAKTNDHEMDGETAERIRSIVDELPSPERAVIRGLFFDGDKVFEISRSMGVHKSSVQYYRDKAIVRLRDKLAKYA
jgi:RNA polymerase sigma factor (sigma-70 family)